MKKKYWYFLAIFVAFVSMFALMPHHSLFALPAPAGNDAKDDLDDTVTGKINGMGQSDTLDRDSENAGDEEEDDAPEEDFGGGNNSQ